MHTPDKLNLFDDENLSAIDLVNFVNRTLSLREREVFVPLARGTELKEIAARFQITYKTMRAHRTQILQKLGLANRSELAVLYYRVNKLFVPPDPSIGPMTRIYHFQRRSRAGKEMPKTD